MKHLVVFVFASSIFLPSTLVWACKGNTRCSKVSCAQAAALDKMEIENSSSSQTETSSTGESSLSSMRGKRSREPGDTPESVKSRNKKQRENSDQSAEVLFQEAHVLLDLDSLESLKEIIGKRPYIHLYRPTNNVDREFRSQIDQTLKRLESSSNFSKGFQKFKQSALKGHEKAFEYLKAYYFCKIIEMSGGYTRWMNYLTQQIDESNRENVEDRAAIEVFVSIYDADKFHDKKNKNLKNREYLVQFANKGHFSAEKVVGLIYLNCVWYFNRCEIKTVFEHSRETFDAGYRFIDSALDKGTSDQLVFVWLYSSLLVNSADFWKKEKVKEYLKFVYSTKRDYLFGINGFRELLFSRLSESNQLNEMMFDLLTTPEEFLELALDSLRLDEPLSSSVLESLILYCERKNLSQHLSAIVFSEKIPAEKVLNYLVQLIEKEPQKVIERLVTYFKRRAEQNLSVEDLRKDLALYSKFESKFNEYELNDLLFRKIILAIIYDLDGISQDPGFVHYEIVKSVIFNKESVFQDIRYKFLSRLFWTDRLSPEYYENSEDFILSLLGSTSTKERNWATQTLVQFYQEKQREQDLQNLVLNKKVPILPVLVPFLKLYVKNGNELARFRLTDGYSHFISLENHDAEAVQLLLKHMARHADVFHRLVEGFLSQKGIYVSISLESLEFPQESDGLTKTFTQVIKVIANIRSQSQIDKEKVVASLLKTVVHPIARHELASAALRAGLRLERDDLIGIDLGTIKDELQIDFAAHIKLNMERQFDRVLDSHKINTHRLKDAPPRLEDINVDENAFNSLIQAVFNEGFKDEGSSDNMLAKFQSNLDYCLGRKSDRVVTTEVQLKTKHVMNYLLSISDKNDQQSGVSSLILYFQNCTTAAKEAVDWLYVVARKVEMEQASDATLNPQADLASSQQNVLRHPLMDYWVWVMKRRVVDQKILRVSDTDIQAQWVHVSHAVRKIIGRELGLFSTEDGIGDDPVQTKHIFDAFRIKKLRNFDEWKPYLLKEFAIYYTPNFLIRALTKEINKWMGSDVKKYNTLISVFTHGSITEIKPEFFDTTSDVVLITDQGSTKLLEAYHYIIPQQGQINFLHETINPNLQQ